MAASTATRRVASVAIDEIVLPVAASKKIYGGTAVCVNTSGDAQMADDAANLKFIGMARNGVDVDNSGGNAGDLNVYVKPIGLGTERYQRFACSSATKAWEGVMVYFVDDNTVALAATTTHDVPAGIVIKFESATSVVVDTAAAVDAAFSS